MESRGCCCLLAWSTPFYTCLNSIQLLWAPTKIWPYTKQQEFDEDTSVLLIPSVSHSERGVLWEVPSHIKAFLFLDSESSVFTEGSKMSAFPKGQSLELTLHSQAWELLLQCFRKIKQQSFLGHFEQPGKPPDVPSSFSRAPGASLIPNKIRLRPKNALCGLGSFWAPSQMKRIQNCA